MKQSPAATLPAETIALILELAQAEESSDLEGGLAQREDLFIYGLVCRSWSAEVARLQR